ncbi:MAG: hypothetical protein GY866_00715, partial [Proteobacteria bacterium]|nr:hypothetical protein [Pseudomonadota bacterium]
LMKRFARLYFVDILGVCIMGNHFHMLLRMHPGEEFSDEEIRGRLEDFY